MMCALGSHGAHESLTLDGRPDSFHDPDNLLSGIGTGSRHFKLTSLEELPREQVRGWLATSAEYVSNRR
jgi:hypothetical protein